ncbi:hypothetical protein HanXRQr2_Chr09g0385281 [Helianthus annuus]|uniref:Uncharacterized protein n=1 Tax=Helianthus annuus TaxID=4232 RepID=A0A251TUL6_HELAN|nr:hypothetical protein HanXRQr2_Chr09g0385281 [Helianthus annuus]
MKNLDILLDFTTNIFLEGPLFYRFLGNFCVKVLIFAKLILKYPSSNFCILDFF